MLHIASWESHLLSFVDITEYFSATFAQAQSSSETPNHVAHYTQGCHTLWVIQAAHFQTSRIKSNLVSLQKLSEPKTHDAIFPNPKAREPRPSHHQSLYIASPNNHHASFSFRHSQNAIEICQQTPSLPAQHYAPYHAIKLPRNYLILQMPAGKALMITPT